MSSCSRYYLRLDLTAKAGLCLHQWMPFWVMLESYPQEIHGGCHLVSLRASFSNLPSMVLLPCAHCSLANWEWAPCFSIKCTADTDTPVRSQQADHKSQSFLQRFLFSDFSSVTLKAFGNQIQIVVINVP